MINVFIDCAKPIMKIGLFTLGLLIFSNGNVHSEDRETTHFLFKPLNEYIEKMEDPQRVEWQMPDKVIESLLIKPGDAIADIGAGTGYFTIPFAKKVGNSGKIFAVDVEKRMLEYIEFRARKNGLNNIDVVLSTPSSVILQKSSLDLIFICNTYLYLEKRDAYLKTLKDVLRNNGRVAIIDFHMIDPSTGTKESVPGGPPLNKRISRERVLEEILKSGFKLEAEYFYLPYQYFLVFTK